ncbi:MAG: hypothetical protein HKM97_07560, partial [Acidimicrobiia bacterium]|nr:hypothetical protein [Acidimicrobiia bacterium]
VAPGTWRGAVLQDSCYWERLSGFGGEFDEVEANNFTTARQIVTLKSTDAGFRSDDCGEWTRDLSPITASPTSPFGDGMYFVGTDIAAGTWRSRGDFAGSCYWERLDGFTGDFDELIANDFIDVAPIVSISATDAGFSAEDCGTWDYLGP